MSTLQPNGTPLHYACAHGHPDVVTLLLQWNCDIELRDSYNSTALIKAAQYGHEACLTILLEHGADPNAIDNNGSAALHYAVYRECISMVTILLEYKADTSITNKDGVSPLILAQQGSHESLIKLLAGKDTVKRTEEAEEPERTPGGSNSHGSSSPKEFKDKVKEVSNKFDPNKFVPHERNSEYCEMFSFDKILSLIEDVMRQSKDSSSLMRIWNAVHSYEKSLEHKTHAFDRLQEKYEDLKINLRDIQKTASQTVIEMVKVDTENTKLKAEMHSLRVKLENLQATTNRQGGKSKECQTTQDGIIQSSTSSLEDGKKTINEQEKEITRLNQEISDLHETKNHLAEESQKSLATKDEQIQSLTSSLEDGKKTISELEKEITRLNQEISDLHETKNHLAEESQKSLATKDAAFQSLTCRFEDWEKNIGELEKEISRLLLEISELQETTSHQAEESKKSMATKDEVIQSLKCSLEDRGKTISELEKEISRVNQEISDLKETKNHQAEESIKSLATKNQSIQAFTMHSENGKEEENKLLKEIDRLNHEISILQSTKKHQDEEMQELQTNQII